jgi:hypothetical protein
VKQPTSQRRVNLLSKVASLAMDRVSALWLFENVAIVPCLLKKNACFIVLVLFYFFRFVFMRDMMLYSSMHALDGSLHHNHRCRRRHQQPLIPPRTTNNFNTATATTTTTAAAATTTTTTTTTNARFHSFRSQKHPQTHERILDVVCTRNVFMIQRSSNRQTQKSDASTQKTMRAS